MSAHELLAYSATVAWLICLGSALFDLARGRDSRWGLFRSGRSREAQPGQAPTVGLMARRVGAVAILLMLASKCAGSY